MFSCNFLLVNAGISIYLVVRFADWWSQIISGIAWILHQGDSLWQTAGTWWRGNQKQWYSETCLSSAKIFPAACNVRPWKTIPVGKRIAGDFRKISVERDCLQILPIPVLHENACLTNAPGWFTCADVSPSMVTKLYFIGLQNKWKQMKGYQFFSHLIDPGMLIKAGDWFAVVPGE